MSRQLPARTTLDNLRKDAIAAQPAAHAPPAAAADADAAGIVIGSREAAIKTLLDAASRGDTPRVTMLLDAQPDIINERSGSGVRTALHGAANAGHDTTVALLLERGADLTNRRRRPLHLAIVKKQPAALATLLDLGAKTDTLDEAALTPLDQAALDGETAMAQLLIDRGADVRLPAAVALRRTQDIERLLREDPACLKPGQRWSTLILRASETSAGHVVETLIRLGASVDVWDDPKTAVDSSTRFTPLHAAAWTGNAEAAAVLLRHGANPAAREEQYCGTPAGWANYAGHGELRDLILQGPIDPFEALDFDLIDRLAGIVARDPGAIDRPFGAYVTGRPRPDAWWPDAWHTPLAVAIARNKLDAARVLIALGADRTVSAPDGRTLVDLATQQSRAQVAALLTASGA